MSSFISLGARLYISHYTRVIQLISNTVNLLFLCNIITESRASAGLNKGLPIFKFYSLFKEGQLIFLLASSYLFVVYYLFIYYLNTNVPCTIPINRLFFSYSAYFMLNYVLNLLLNFGSTVRTVSVSNYFLNFFVKVFKCQTLYAWIETELLIM